MGVNGYVDIDVTASGHLQVSAVEHVPNALDRPEVSVVRFTPDGAMSFSALAEAGMLELSSREAAKADAS